MDTPVRWVSYTTKWATRSQRMLGGSPVAATWGLKRRAKEWYANARKSGAIIDARENWTNHGLIPLRDYWSKSARPRG